MQGHGAKSPEKGASRATGPSESLLHRGEHRFQPSRASGLINSHQGNTPAKTGIQNRTDACRVDRADIGVKETHIHTHIEDLVETEVGGTNGQYDVN